MVDPPAGFDYVSEENYLFKQAGYNYNPITYKVIGRSKFGGQGKESDLGKDEEEIIRVTIIKEKEEFCEFSLLENKKFIEFVQQPLCDMGRGV